MAKLKDLEKYLGYEFSSSSYTGQDYKAFQTKYINYLKDMCKHNNWELVNVGRNHYCFSTFISNNKGAFVYLAISDVRYSKSNWYNNILIRTASNERDYTGGRNNYTSLPNLKSVIDNLFIRRS